MNCMELRRSLLVNPRLRDRDQQMHARECAACLAFAEELDDFESMIEEAVRVPVPEALAERVILRQRTQRSGRRVLFALAASLALAIGVGMHVYRGVDTVAEEPIAATSPGHQDPAVAAISYVLEHEPQLLRTNQSGDPAVMRDALFRLGMTLPEDRVKVRYPGKCPVPGGTGEHLVLATPFGHVTLILVPDRSLGTRVVVDFRGRTAVSSPIRSGSYIVVADSLQTVKKLEQMLM